MRCAAALIHVEADRSNPERLSLILPGADAPVAPTHWSFGQLAAQVGAPAAYLRNLPAALAGINLQYGLTSNRAEQIKTLETDDGRVELRAVTGPDYGRIYDYELVEAVQRIAGNGTGDTRWKVPGVLDWSTGIYNPRVDITKDTTTLMAFTVSQDHARQEQVWEAVRNSWQKEPWHIRRALTEKTVHAADKRAVFIGAETYEAAGGVILRDLFESDNGGWLQDVGLLDRLVAEKLKTVADEIANEGWRWVDAAVDIPYGITHGLRRITRDVLDMSGEERATRDALEAELDEVLRHLSRGGTKPFTAFYITNNTRVSDQNASRLVDFLGNKDAKRRALSKVDRLSMISLDQRPPTEPRSALRVLPSRH